FSFGPSSSSFESTYLTSPSLPRFPVRLCWQPLDSIFSVSPSETCPPSSEQHLWTPSVRKHQIKVLIRGKDQLIKPRGSSPRSRLHRTCDKINTLNFIISLSVFCMWVRLAKNKMTEHSGQADTAETLKRTLSEHSHQIQAQGSSLRSLHEQQWQTNQQLEQISSLLQHVLSTKDSPSPGGATEPLLS
ncbi:hypothetical protein ILYODFUR_005583, partial [Ilyodon furcidens]